MIKLFTFKQFDTFISMIWPVTLIGSVLLLCIGMLVVFGISPPDYQQGYVVRIMYIHVPSSWLALAIFFFMGMTSVVHIVWKSNLAAIIAKSCAPIGTMCALISIVTGSIWGKPTWGAWWVWDARLTSMLLLLVLYIGYMVMHSATPCKERAYTSSSVIAIIGMINLPIIKFSVNWWHTLHQPASILRREGVAIHSQMLVPLGILFLGLVFLCATLIIVRIKTELLQHKIQAHWQKIASRHCFEDR